MEQESTADVKAETVPGTSTPEVDALQEEIVKEAVETWGHPLNKPRRCFPHRRVNTHSRNPENGEKEKQAP